MMNHLSEAIDTRVDSGRCITCNHVIVDAYFCDKCGFGEPSGHYQDERRSVTASQVSRSMQRRVDQGAAYEQWSDLISCMDASVIPAEQTHAPRGAPRHNRGSESIQILSATGNAAKLRAALYEASFKGVMSAFRESAKVPAANKNTSQIYEVHDRVKARRVRHDAFRAALKDQQERQKSALDPNSEL